MSTVAPSRIQQPDLATLLKQVKSDIFRSMNCHKLGTITVFNAARQTAEIKLNFRYVIGDQVGTYPLLVDCPVFVYSGGSACVTMPVSVGDTCLVMFHDRDIDSWFASGNITVPNTQRVHDLSDGLAIVGFRSLANVVGGYSSDSLDIRGGDGLIDFKTDAATLRAVLEAIIAALSALNSAKSGPSVAPTIAFIQPIIDDLLK